MMAFPKEQAIALKNNYVAGLIEAGATAPMPTMPEQMMGNQASIVRDLDRMEDIYTNDGDPYQYFKRGGRIMQVGQPKPSNAMPLPGHPYGAKGRQPMSPSTANIVNEGMDALIDIRNMR